MTHPINNHQPIRPSVHPETNNRLLYRVYPKLPEDPDSPKRVYRTCEPANQICQMQLYRWCQSDEFVESPSFTDLYNYLIIDPKLTPSKGHFSRTVSNALDYKPTRLKGVTKDNDHARQIFVFGSSLELKYGLEYMICAWLRRFLNDQSAQGSVPIFGRDMMAEELEILTNTSWDEYLGLYVDPLRTIDFKKLEEPNWRELRNKEGIPIIEDQDTERKEPKGKLRSF